jgi:hypothetical protein
MDQNGGGGKSANDRDMLKESGSLMTAFHGGKRPERMR